MIRTLAMIAVAGFVLSLGCLIGAVAIGGPEVITRSAWSGGHNWSFGWTDDDFHHHDRHHRHATSARDISWTGGDRLVVEVPGEVTYVQGSGPAKLTVSGPAEEINDVVLKDGVLGFTSGDHHDDEDLTFTLTAPNVSSFELHGSNKLTLQNYQQPKLSLNLTGDAEVDVEGGGRADKVDVDISGSANADLSEIKATDAAVRISGSGEAKVAPTNSAKIAISGSGDVYLKSHPAHVDTDITGSGQLHQGDDD